jgi:fluoride exporter
MIYLLIALGGAGGSVLRYLLGGVIQRSSGSGFPIGTMVVNVSGCFLIGILVRQFLTMQLSNDLRALLIVGFCGGFTTFSTFSAETLALIEGGEYSRATAYVFLSLILCLLGTLAGMTAIQLVSGARHG